MKNNFTSNFQSKLTSSSLTLLLILTSFYSSKAQLSAIIGAGSLSPTSSNSAAGDPGPMYRSGATSAFIYSRYHYLYTAQELAANGIVAGSQITRLAWFKNNNVKTNSPCLFEVWVKNSTLATIGLGGQNWATLIGNSTSVYSNSSHQVDTILGWHEIIFSSPYLYTGGALEISVNFDISQGASPWTSGGFAWKKDTVLNSTLSYTSNLAPGAVLPNLRIVRPQVKITYLPAPACTAPPASGTINASSNSVCSGANFSLFLSGGTTGSGLTYQWESSPDSIAWTAISGATFAALGISQTSSTYYRCTLTCSAQSSTTPGIKISMSSFINCYCSSVANSGAGADIGNVSFVGLNNGVGTPSVSNPAASSTYSDFTALTPVSVNQGGTYPITITQINSGAATTSCFSTAYIDFNHNGVFDATGENFSIGQTSAALGNVVSGNISIPLTALTGLTRMRLLLRTTGNASQASCGAYATGETEDYFIFIDLFNQVNNLDAETNFSLAPNPASDFILLNFSNPTKENASISILSVTNQLVYEETINSNSTEVSKKIKLDDFPKGIYFVQLKRASGIVTRKMILD